MKLLIVLALVAMAARASAQACSDVENCNKCDNPGPLCHECPHYTVISANRKKCLDCSTGCDTCTANAQDVTTCIKCKPHFYLKDGVCEECSDGCTTCHEDDAVVVCDHCESTGYVHDLTQASKPCLACPSNCKTCTKMADGSTQCSECFSYSGLNKKGYFLKASDKSCKPCPNNCEKCNDNGEGTGICTDCDDHYIPNVDADDATNSGTKCYSCPSDCLTCTGEAKTGNTAKCIECKPDLGNYLTDDACDNCFTGCKNCDSEGACTECDKTYRLSDGTCIKCPAKCDVCKWNEDTGEAECDDCQVNYGFKPTSEKTCDNCGISNCATCRRNSEDGSFTCQSCQQGYVKEGNECKACPTGCKLEVTCQWNDTASETQCDGGNDAGEVCDRGYTADVNQANQCMACPAGCQTVYCTWNDAGDDSVCDDSLPVGQSCDDGYTDVASNDTTIGCKPCTDADDHCTKCEFDEAGTTVVCTVCAAGYHLDDAGDCFLEADEIAGCATFIPANRTCAENGCDEGYMPNEAGADTCIQCTVSNCKTCPSAADTCTGCKDGYYLDGNQCKGCTPGCRQCTASGCTTCKDLYAKTDTNKCKACPSKCSDCDYDAGKGETTCKSGRCDLNGITGYVVNGDGQCEECPAHCHDCEYDDTTLLMVVCKSNGCDEGYGRKDDKMCHECPHNCKECATDGENDKLICDTCNHNHAINEFQCAKCPSNCAECANNDGSMVCSLCSAGYALDSSNACVKCPSHCKSCSATTCTECNSGYALSGDRKSCVACSSAAFDHCALCTSIDAASDKANCTACSSGYVLEDEEEYLSCKSTSELSCAGGSTYDNDAECSECAADFDLTEDHKCAKTCYLCGNPEDGEFVPTTQCTIPAAGANLTDTDAKPIHCFSGVCYAGRNQAGEVNAGCRPSSSDCISGEGESCKDLPDGTKLCFQCCDTEEMCNEFVQRLDGVPDSAPTNMAATSLLLFTGAALLAAF